MTHIRTNCLSAVVRILGLAALGLTISASMAVAAVKTVTLDVPGMTCAACPLTVKKALTKVEGVQKADVSYEKKRAVVTFDDQKTSIQKITEATKEAGYPSAVKE